MIYFSRLASNVKSADNLISKWASEEDIQYAASRKNELAKRNSLLARATLRRLLALNEFDASAEIFRSDKGKPYLADGPHIALSHSHKLVAAGISRQPFGIDIEFIRRRNFMKLAAYAFGPREVKMVEEKGSAEFYRIWTMREAIAKMKGESIFTNLNGKDTDLAALSVFHDWSSADYVLAIATSASDKPMKDMVKEIDLTV